ncbi:MAG: sigma 54-interacting transcriptional regulator [Fibrobacteria bacterium]|nr:sigma 54-interacting transcriptional regulator [Fibrobacteria bacterium]
MPKQRTKTTPKLAREIRSLACAFTPEGHILSANKTFCDYVNSTLKEINNVSFYSLIKKSHLKTITALFKNLSPEVNSFQLDYNPFSTNEKVDLTGWVGLAEFEGSDKAIEYKILGEDNSEQKLTRFAFKTLQTEINQLFNLAVPSCIVNNNFKIIRANVSFCELFEMDASNVIGADCHDVVPNPLCGTKTCPMQGISNENNTIKNELEVTLPSGKKLNCLLQTVPYFGSDGEKIGLIETFTDLSEKKELERRKFELQKMESIGTLACGIAHDFNNILGAILGFSQKMAKGGEQSALEKYAGFINKACERGSDLTNKLMAFARKGIFNNVDTDYHELLEETLNILTHTIEKNITLQTFFTSKSATGFCDQAQIQNIVLNIVANARQAMPHGGSISLTTEVVNLKEDTSKHHRYVKISITDTGTGISKANLKHIFEPFFSTKGEKGTGFGLASAYGVLRSHNGKIEVESEEGQGSTFHLYLPWHSISAHRRIQKSLPPLRSLTHSHKEVILIDDDELMGEMYNSVLEDSGFNYQVFTSAIQAVEYYQKNKERIGVVVLDMIMPEMTGRECFFKLHDLNPDVKVVLLSGYAPSKDTLEIMKHGVRYLNKPIHPEDLLNEIEALMELGEIKEELLQLHPASPVKKPAVDSAKSGKTKSTKKQPAIMVVDDDRFLSTLLQELLNEKEYATDIYLSAEHALNNLKQNKYQLAIVDYKMPGIDGLTLIKTIRDQFPNIHTVLMTGVTNSASIKRKAKKIGVDYFIQKPLDISFLNHIADDIFKPGKQGQSVTSSKQQGEPQIIKNSPAMKQVWGLLSKIAKSDVSLLITGDTGVGKELVARAIHEESYRNNNEFITINCPSLPDNLLESELFGFEKGSFTGANQTKKGLFEWAHEGSFFLDEIGDLNIELQAKLLRVIQEGKIRRIGGKNEIDINVRLISATNKDLEQLVAQGSFREDLYYRLNAVKIEVPSLKDRQEDIPALTEVFIQEFNRTGMKHIEGIDKEVIRRFQQYPWPGNVREFKNTLQEICILSNGSILTTNDLPLKLQEQAQVTPKAPDTKLNLDGFMESAKKDYLIELLRQYKGNVPLCAKHAGINRTSLYHILKKLNISAKSFS